MKTKSFFFQFFKSIKIKKNPLQLYSLLLRVLRDQPSHSLLVEGKFYRILGMQFENMRLELMEVFKF